MATFSQGKNLLGSRQSNEQLGEKQNSEVVDGVLVDEIDHTHETTLGPELVGLKAWEDLELNELLGKLSLSGTQCRGAACSVINRLVDPVTENQLPLWLQTSSLPDNSKMTIRNLIFASKNVTIS